MNNIFLPNDPLLSSGYQQLLYDQMLMRDREQLDKQYREYINSLQTQKVEDKMAQLNECLHKLSIDTKTKIQENPEFAQLNRELLDFVQCEIIDIVKDRINGNPDMIANINKQMKIINDIDSQTKEQERKNMTELNDYLNNYSNMSFDEYKKMKTVQ